MICVSVQAHDTPSAMEKIARAGVLADLVELRLDLICGPQAEVLVAASKVPVIATVRSRREGGRGMGLHRTMDLLMRARGAGAAYVDVEFGLPKEARRTLIREAGPGRVVLSSHMTGTTPPSAALKNLLDRMACEDAAIIKIVTRACGPEDPVRVLSLIPKARAMGIGISAFCMGWKGMLSRILSLRLGATLGYAALDERDKTAEGQIPVRLMRLVLERLGQGCPARLPDYGTTRTLDARVDGPAGSDNRSEGGTP
jgi:3-dehydroquinate dehydratase type I